MDDGPLRGRAGDLESLRGVVAEGHNVVIAGPAGIGKTRLAREVIGSLESTSWVAATSALQSISFGAFAHLLEADDWLPPDDLLVALRSAAEAVIRSGSEVVVVDDLHLLDERSLALVHHLLRSNAVTVLATVRDRADASDHVQGLWKDGLVDLHDLGPLAVDGVGAIVVDALEGAIDTDIAGDLHRLTGGNPLLLCETVRSAVASGALDAKDGRWRWRGIGLPSSDLVGAVRARLSPLGMEAITAAEVLAIGEPLPLSLLCEVAGDEGVTALEAAALVRAESPSGELRFAHPLFGEVLAASLGAARRQVINGRLARAMDGHAETPTDRLRLARWQLGSGAEHTAETWTEAAVLANTRFSHSLAAELARRARSAGGGFASSLALGSALVGLRRYHEADELLASIEHQARTDDDLVELAVTRHLARASHPFSPTGFAQDLERTEKRIKDPDRRAFVRATRATHLCFGGDLEEGAALVDLVLAELGDRHDQEAEAVRVRLAVPHATLNIHSGRTLEAAAMSASLLAPALELADRIPGAPAWAATSWLSSLVVGGHLDAATQVLEQFRATVAASDLSVEFRDQATVFLDLCDGQLMALRGDVPGAVAMLRRLVVSPDRATSQIGEQPPIGTFPMATHFMVEAAAAAADLELARRAGRAIEGMLHWPVFQEVSDLCGAWALAAGGAVGEAAAKACGVARAAADRGKLTSALFAAHTAARLGAPGEVAGLMEDLSGRVDLAVAPLCADHGVALAADDGVLLDAASTRFDEAGFTLLAAEAAAVAAPAHRRVGRAQAGVRSAARGADLLARCGGVRPAWLPSLDAPIPLTRREREVTNLAARGMTSGAIAERLFVSARTVEGHLLRAYQKLGVRNREELARRLGAGEEVCARGVSTPMEP